MSRKIKHQKKQVQVASAPQSEGQHQLIVANQQWAGPLPPPSLLQGYDEVLPGCAERIVRSMEREQEHRHEMDKRLVDTYRTVYTRGQAIASVVALGSLAGAIYLGINGQTAPSVAALTVGLGQAVLAFLGFKNDRAEEVTTSKED